MLKVILGEGGYSHKISHKGFQQPPLGDMAKNHTKSKELFQIEVEHATTRVHNKS
jgi:hypothetical protein